MDSSETSDLSVPLNGKEIKDEEDILPSKRLKLDDSVATEDSSSQPSVENNGPTDKKPAEASAEDESGAESSFLSADASGTADVSRTSDVSGTTGDVTDAAGDKGGRSLRQRKQEEDGSDAESTTGLEEGEFLVEKIIDYVRENGVDMFLIKWKGWSHAHNTWEPQDNLSCMEMMLDFFKERELAHQKRKSKTQPSQTREEFVRMFEEEHFHPTEQQLAEEFSRRAANGQLKFKEKLKPIKVVHMEIESLVRRLGLKATTMKALRKIQQLKDQLLMHRLEKVRDAQLVKLKQWEESINTLCSDSAKIVVENNVDLALPPENFTYKNDYVPGEGVVIPSDPVIGCECESCFPGNSCCGAKADAPVAYTRAGKLRLQVGEPIYECNKACKCGPDCFNRIVQKGRKVKLSIFRTPNGCGWGVKALEPIKRGTFVTEYVGEVITNEEAERRGEQYDSVGVTYLFDLDFNDQANLYTVDAAMYGNVSHFINHSCEPNLVVYGLWSDCLDPNLPRLALFACRDILRGEQLFFDYNSPLGSNANARVLPSPTAGGVTAAPARPAEGAEDGSRTPPRSAAPGPEPLASPTKSPRRSLGKHPTARVTCKCGAKACRRYLF